MHILNVQIVDYLSAKNSVRLSTHAFISSLQRVIFLLYDPLTGSSESVQSKSKLCHSQSHSILYIIFCFYS